MPRPKGISSRHKSVTGGNQVRQRKTPRDNWCFNCNNSHSKSNELSLPVIYVSPPLKNLVINPSQLLSVCQQSSSSSRFTPHDKCCFNRKDVNSKRNELPSRVIPVTPQLNYLVINTPQLSPVCQQ